MPDSGAVTEGAQSFAGAKNFEGSFGSAPGVTQDVATGNTITLPTSGFNKRVTATVGAATGAILPVGTSNGMIIVIVNVHATNAITFAAAGTSLVADGTATVMLALTATALIWDATAGRWFHVS